MSPLPIFVILSSPDAAPTTLLIGQIQGDLAAARRLLAGATVLVVAGQHRAVVAVEQVERACFSAAPFLMVGLRLEAPVSLSGEAVGQLSAATAGQALPE